MILSLVLLGAVLLGIFGGVIFLLNRTNGTIQSGGMTRRYLLYVPDSCDPDQPAALVISFHGLVQWPAHQAYLSRWNRLADREGFLVVYPRGTGFPLRWQVRSLGSPGDRSEGEVGFIKDLIDHLSGSYSINQRRIYANGMSNGAGMTNLLAWKLSDRIAAFGGVAGAYLDPLKTAPPRRPIPWMVFHGTDDPIVPYRGRTRAAGPRPHQLPSVEDWVSGWVGRNGCPDRLETELTSRVTRIDFRGEQPDARVVFFRIEGAGHTWPGGGWLPRVLTGKTNHEISATELMWQFFQRYTLDR